MNEYEINISPYDIERSLLQKAVRRADAEIVRKTVAYLMSVGDTAWLRKRLFVIGYEECWPMAFQLNGNSIMNDYNKICCTVKNKNALGLAKLAIESGSFTLNPPDDFWKSNNFNVKAAKLALSKVAFPQDKAMIYAAAYLIKKGNIPPIQPTEPVNDPDFPFWIAIYRHTAEGRNLIYAISDKVKIDYFHLARMIFYKAGVLCNEIIDSPFYDKFIEMREESFKDYVKGIIIEKTASQVDHLKERLEIAKEEYTLF